MQEFSQWCLLGRRLSFPLLFLMYILMALNNRMRQAIELPFGQGTIPDFSVSVALLNVN